jgi:hypothetical protein
MYQHARGSRPNPEFGYCLDDNARALIVAIRAHALLGESGLIDYVRHYLAFVERCQRTDGRFRNFMSAEGTWLDEVGSEDAHGRAIWALGFAAARSPQTEVRLRALRCLDRSWGWLGGTTWLRAQAFVLLGIRHWRAAEPSSALDDLSHALASSLAAAYRRSASPDWRWFEDELTYANARLPEALLAAGQADLGLDSLAWLCGLLEVDGCVSLIGNRGWYHRNGQRAIYDQQPIDAAALVSACSTAYRLSGEERFRRWAELGYRWFVGQNVAGLSMIDADTGGCCDGLTPSGVNANQGAESLLAWLLAWEDMAEMGWL